MSSEIPQSTEHDDASAKRMRCPGCGNTYPMGTERCEKDGTRLIETDSLIGQVVGDGYRLDRLERADALGRLYEATNPTVAGIRFAVLVVHARHVKDQPMWMRFLSKAQALKGLKNTRVASVREIGRTAADQPFAVSVWPDGSSLSERLTTHPKWALRPAVRLVRQISQAVAAAHRKAIMHHDLRPENVFVSGEPDRPECTVLGFGVSTFKEASLKAQASSLSGAAAAFVAPEQVRGEPADHRADVYAVGAILFTLLTGRAPVDAVTKMAVPKPRSIEPSIPEAVQQVILRAMARTPADRFHFLDKLDAALLPFDEGEEDLVDEMMGGLDAAISTPPPAAGPGARRAGRTAGAAAAPAATGAGARAADSMQPESQPAAAAEEGESGAKEAKASASPPRRGPPLRGPGAPKANHAESTAAAGEPSGLEDKLFGAGAKDAEADGLDFSGLDQPKKSSGTGSELPSIDQALTEDLFGIAADSKQPPEPALPAARVGDPAAEDGLPSDELPTQEDAGTQADAVPPDGAHEDSADARAPRAAEGAPDKLEPSGTEDAPTAAEQKPAATPRMPGPAKAAVAAQPAATAGRAEPEPERKRSGMMVGLGVAAVLAIGAVAAWQGGLFGGKSGAPSASANAAAPSTAQSTAAKPTAATATSTPSAAPSSGRAAELRDQLVSQAKAGKTADALGSLEEVAKLDPSALDTPEARAALADLLVRAKNLPAADVDRAYETTAHKLGAVGPDVLFELFATKGGSDAAKHAEKLLGDDQVRALGTPALRVAYELRTARGCPGKLALLDRARAEGDTRAQTELKGILECNPAAGCCMKDNIQLKEVLAAISTRLAGGTAAPSGTGTESAAASSGSAGLPPGTVPTAAASAQASATATAAPSAASTAAPTATAAAPSAAATAAPKTPAKPAPTGAYPDDL